MNDVNNISNSVMDSLAVAKKTTEESKDNEMGQEAFLKLFITQLSNQDPLNPQDSSEFISQLAQFSSLEGVTSLNDTMEEMATSFRSSQALQASALVGRSVMVPTDKAPLTPGGEVSGMFELPSATDSLKINISDTSGRLISTLDMGSRASGEVQFAWDGTDSEGNLMPAGTYIIEAIAGNGDGASELGMNLGVNVNSVSLGADSTMTLNLEGGDSVPFAAIKQFL